MQGRLLFFEDLERAVLDGVLAVPYQPVTRLCRVDALQRLDLFGKLRSAK